VKGYSCYGLIPCSTVSWDLYWIAVDPDQQGSGLGRRILKLTEDKIAAAGGLAVYAETSGRPQYVPTRAFYDRTGYATGAVFADFYGPGDAKYVFVKRVGAAGNCQGNAVPARSTISLRSVRRSRNLALKHFSYPDLDDRLPGHTQPFRFPVEGLDHQVGKSH